MTANREIRLQGAPNFRDIGGHATTDGRCVRRGQIFRSGELSNISDADLDTLCDLDIAYVADLRSIKEGNLLRTRWPGGMKTEHHRADISMALQLNGRPLTDVLRDDPTPNGAARVVGEGFRQIPDLCGPALKTITERLAVGPGAVLFHCTNGRDRTGVVSAMLLYQLGATREAIVQDFMTTNDRLDVERVIENSIKMFRDALGIPVSRETMALCTLVRPEYIDIMFDSVAEQYGSPEDYLRAFGIDAALTQKLRQRLLETA